MRITIASSNIDAIELICILRQSTAIKRDHICPDLIHICTVCIIKHIWCKTTARTHIDFKRNYFTLICNTRHVLIQTEKLKMNKTALYIKCFYASSSCIAHIIWQLLFYVKISICLIIYNIHNGHRSHISRFKKNISLAIDDCIIGTDRTIYIRFC